jgi:hypothetical protein
MGGGNMIWYYVHGFFIFLISLLIEALIPNGYPYAPIIATILTGMLVIKAIRDKE